MRSLRHTTRCACFFARIKLNVRPIIIMQDHPLASKDNFLRWIQQSGRRQHHAPYGTFDIMAIDPGSFRLWGFSVDKLLMVPRLRIEIIHGWWPFIAYKPDLHIYSSDGDCYFCQQLVWPEKNHPVQCRLQRCQLSSIYHAIPFASYLHSDVDINYCIRCALARLAGAIIDQLPGLSIR